MKKIYTTIAALLLVLCAVWNIKCESSLSEGTNDKRNIRQAHKFCEQQDVQQYIHENSKPYKKSLKQDTLFAERLDSIERHKSLERRDDKVLKFTTHKPYMPK